MDAEGGCDEDVALGHAGEAGGRAAGQYLAHPAGDTTEPGFGDFRGYFAQRKRKLASQSAQLAGGDTDMMFSGVVFHINGYTQPSHYELKRMLVAHGGRFLHYLAKSEVTHIVASSLTLSKERALAGYRVVRPEWVVDSVRAGRRLAWEKYALGAAPRRVPAGPPGGMPDEPLGLSLTPEEPPEPSVALALPPPPPPLPPPGHPGLAPVVDRFDEGLSRPWVRRNLATAPGFVARYYASSRLHHLATWKAEMQDLVGQLRSRQPQPQRTPAPPPVDGGGPRVVMHVDFDCFFVSVSLLRHPELQGQPAAVCHAQESPGDAGAGASTSQIASCSYAARGFGVRNGMLLGQAHALCPQLATVAYDFAAYRRVAREFFAVAVEMSDETQVVSVDEALLDVSRRAPDEASALALAEGIRRRVFAATGCRVSVGVGPSACVARAATRLAKPDGARWLSLDGYLAQPLRLADLGGVGDTLGGQLRAAGLAQLADVRHAGLLRTQAVVGQAKGRLVFDGCWGRDAGPLVSDARRQAFGCEIGWGVRISTAEEAAGFVRQLADHAYAGMRRAGRWARAATLRVKVRRSGAGRPAKFLGHGLCDAVSRCVELRGRGREHVLDRCVEALVALGLDPLDIRAVGVRLHRLEDEAEERRGVAEMLAGGAAASAAAAACAMPAASQVDPDVLAQLPADVRREIEQHYTSSTAAAAAAAAAAPSAAKRGTRGRGRGRPRKPLLSTRQHHKQQQQQQQQQQRRLTDAFRRVAQLDSVVPSQADAAVWAGLPASVRRELARDYMRDKPPGASSDEGGEPDEPDGSDESGEPVAAAAAEEPGGDVGEPALCGARGSRDVCGLVGRWVAQAGGSAPLDEDVDALAEFLEALVRARCVARANEVLGHLRRCVACCAPESCAWRRTVAAVLARVNAVCSAMYDASLDV